MEAIIGRPLLLAALGTAAKHANQTTLYLTPPHGKAHIVRQLNANVGAALQHVRAATAQFANLDRWGCLLRYVSDRIAPVVAPSRPLPSLPATRKLPDLGSIGVWRRQHPLSCGHMRNDVVHQVRRGLQ